MSRQELKYFLSNKDEHSLRSFLPKFLKEDPAITSEFGYQVSSLYFDDPNLTCISQKQNGSFRKQKFRIRFYNQDPKQFFLEVKNKNGDFSHKTRGALSSHNLDLFKDIYSLAKFLNHLKSNDPAVCQFLYNYHCLRLRPLLWVHFRRQAYVCPFGSELRITIDHDMRGHFFSSEKEFHSFDSVSFGGPSSLLEIKIKKVIPHWLELFLSEIQIQKVSFSKYYECFCSLERNPFANKKNIHNKEGYI